MAVRKFKHISVGRDGSVWTAGKADGTIYRLGGDALAVGWQADKAGKADIIAAFDRTSIRCVNKDHEIWELTDAQNLEKGGTWSQRPPISGKNDAKTIAFGRDGSCWYAQLDGKIFRSAQPGDGTDMPLWVEDSRIGDAYAVVIAIDDQDNVWCVNKKGEIWNWVKPTWAQIPTHSGRSDAKTISVGSDGSVWYADTAGEVFSGAIPGPGPSDQWQRPRIAGKEKMGPVDVLAVVDRSLVWCLNRKGEVWRVFDGKWQQFVETDLDGNNVWTYEVVSGDHLLAVVRREFNLKDPQDTLQINHLVDQIVVQNPHITRDRIDPGDVITLRY